MSIVVKHSPDLAVMSELAYQGGKGQYNQWLAQFKQQQENAKTEAMLGGFRTGGQLGLGIAGMRQRERMQKAQFEHDEKMPGIRAGAQAGAQAQDDVQFGKLMGGRLFDAVSQRYPLQPEMWSQVQQWPREQQEALLKWSDGVASSRAAQSVRQSPGTIAGGAAAQQADGKAYEAGSDRHQKQRATIIRLHKEGKITDAEAQKYQQRLNRNIRQYGNTPKRPVTSAERAAGDYVVRDLGNGKISYGHYGPKGNYHELYQTPSKHERKAAQLESIKVGTAALAPINEQLNTARDNRKGTPVVDESGIEPNQPGWKPTYIENTPEENAEYDKEIKILERARENVLSHMGSVDSGDSEHLPLLTQDWINRIENNTNMAGWQKNHYILLQRLNPSQYILDRPDLQHLRMNAMDVGHPGQVPGTISGSNLSLGRDRPEDLNRPRFEPIGVPGGGLGPQGEIQTLSTQPSAGASPALREALGGQPPPAGGQPPPAGGPRPTITDPAMRGMTEAERTESGLNIPGRLTRPQELRDRQAEHQKQTKLYNESAAARKTAVSQAHGEHVKVTPKKTNKSKQAREAQRRTTRLKAPSGKKPPIIGDVEALTPRPERLSESGTGFEVELERLYNAYDRIVDRTPVRYVQSMLRKYGYDINRIRSGASAHEQVAFHDAMKRVKQLKDALKRR